MRITKSIISETIANLMVGHILRKRANNYMTNVAEMTSDLVEEHQKACGFASNDDAHTAVTSLKNMSKKYNSDFVDVGVYACRVEPFSTGSLHYHNLLVNVAIAGENRRISLAGVIDGENEISDVAAPGLRKVLCKAAEGTYMPRGRVMIPPGHWLRDRIDDLDAERKSIMEDYETLVSTVTAAMQTHTTAKKLVAAWPYIEPFLPKDGAPKTATGVALNYETLNAICGLPK